MNTTALTPSLRNYPVDVRTRARAARRLEGRIRRAERSLGRLLG